MLYLTYKRKTQYIAQWSREYNISYQTLSYRLNANWSVHKSLTTPVKSNKRGKPRPITYKRKTMSAAKAARKYKIKYDTLLYRLNNGWTVHEALTIPVRKYGH